MSRPVKPKVRPLRFQRSKELAERPHDGRRGKNSVVVCTGKTRVASIERHLYRILTLKMAIHDSISRYMMSSSFVQKLKILEGTFCSVELEATETMARWAPRNGKVSSQASKPPWEACLIVLV